MSLIADIAARLLAEASPPLVSVEGAADIEEAMERSATQREQTPAAFITPLAETPGANQAAIGVSQIVTTTFAVALLVYSARDPRNAAAIDLIDAPRMAIRNALLGWSPDPAADDIVFVGGALAEVLKGGLIWIDRYAIRTVIRS